MPIGDLLAEISGKKPSSAPPAIKASSSAGVKRKADSESSDGVTKISKTSATGSAARNANGDVIKQSVTRRPSPSLNRYSNTTKPSVPAANGQRTSTTSTNGNSRTPYTGTASTPARQNGKAASSYSTSAKKEPYDSASRLKLNASSSSAKVAPAKPSPTTSTATGAPKAPPKKGTFAEIMARAARAQQEKANMTGVIQHKPMERTSKLGSGKLKKTIEHGTAITKKNGARSVGGTRDGLKNGLSKGRDAKTVGKARPNSSGSDVQEKEKEKKFKKAAVAGTGYQGTARPLPSKNVASRSGRPAASRASGGLLAPPKSRSSKYESEYDEELDDFIEYDDDDAEPGRYDYASDGSSDMEAGLSDIDYEEKRAERAAREEDRKEEAMLEKLKREKEERKRRLSTR